jgi:UDP-glucose 4-epimerase
LTTGGADYRDRTVCVTGGAGFIGGHLCEALLARDARVTVIDDLSNGRRENLEPLGDRVTFVEGSILDDDALDRAVGDASVVFHLAAVASVPRSVAEPELYLQVNTMGTLRVLEAARRAGADRVVYASSSSVYGDQPTLPKVETSPPDPRSPYAAAKSAGEHLARAYATCYGLSCVSLRYFNIFGPRQRPDSPYAAVIPKFCAAYGAGETPVIFGDGSQTRDFTFVANAVHANLLAGATAIPLAGEIVNVAAGEGRTVIELIEAVAARLGVEPAYETSPPRPGEVQHSRADIDAARDLLGYEPIVSFDEGLDRTVAHYAELFSRSA